MKEEVACWLVGWLRTGRGGGGDRPVGRSDRLYHLSCNYRHKMPEDFRPLLSPFLPHPHNPPSRGLLDRLPSSPSPSGFLSAPLSFSCVSTSLSLSSFPCPFSLTVFLLLPLSFSLPRLVSVLALSCLFLLRQVENFQFHSCKLL